MEMTTGWDLQACNSQNKLFRDSGFEAEAAKLADRKGQGASARMAEEPSVVGPPERCREQLAAVRDAGIDLPIVNPVPVGDQTYAQAVQAEIETFAQQIRSGRR